MVIVYHFAVYDGINDRSTISPTKRQVEDIRACGAEPLWATGEDVPLSALDEHSRFDPTHRGEEPNA